MAYENKLKELNRCLDKFIKEYQQRVSASFRGMEDFNISVPDFYDKSFTLSVAACTLEYLKRVKTVIKDFDYKAAENFIRFHKYQLETKSFGLADNPVSLTQNTIIFVLTSIIENILDTNI